MATVADILDVESPTQHGGRQLQHLAGSDSGKHQTSCMREDLIMHSSEGMFAIRKGDWKLVEGLGSGGFTLPRFIEPGPGDPAGQLYNLAE